MYTQSSSKKTLWASAALAQLALVSTALGTTPDQLAQRADTPRAIINEVLFDQQGTDAQAQFGCEWVELYTIKNVDLSRLHLEDHNGNRLGNLPQVQIPKNTHVLVILGGLNAYELDDDPSDGTYSLTLGLPLGDILPNAQVAGDFGGVSLFENGAKLDSIYWGNGPQAGNQHAPYYDISFSGGTPMNEGDTLGRSGTPVADYTGTILDWNRNGGVNAAGATPNQRNGVYVLDTGSALKWIQAGFTGIMNSFAYMTEQPNKYRFVDSSVANISVTETADSLTVSADHTFYLLADGVPTQISGYLTAIAIKDETPGQVSYELQGSGTVSAPQGWSFDVQYDRQVTGLHTNTIKASTETHITFNENGVSYPYQCKVTKTMSRTSDNVWLMNDHRLGFDYGGAGSKTSDSSTRFTRQSDGQIASHFDVTRDMPIGPPRPGTLDASLHSQQIVTDVITTGNDIGEFNAVVSRYDVYEGHNRVITLRPSETGMSSLDVLSASPQEPLGSANHMLHLPVSVAGRSINISSGTRGELTLRASGYIAVATSQINTNGLMVNAFVTLADPPLQQGSSSSSKSGEKGFADAAVDCAAKGGAIGAGVGAVGGAVAGGIGGAAVGGAIGTLGGPPGAVAAGTAGGVKGAAVGTIIGTTAGGIVGGGVGAATCMIGHFGEEIAAGASAAWDWLTDW